MQGVIFRKEHIKFISNLTLLITKLTNYFLGDKLTNDLNPHELVN